MTDIRALVQQTLDKAFAADGVCAYSRKKSKTKGAAPDEYIVYTMNGDHATQYADNKPLTKSAGIVLRYYYSEALLETPEGRARIFARENDILAAMCSAGFSCPDGAFDAGDIDGIGYFTTVFDFNYNRVA